MGTVLVPVIGGFGGRWTFPRSYVQGLAQNWPAGCVNDNTTHDWILTLPAAYGFNYKRINVAESVYGWNSNFYTIDHIWEDFYVAGPALPPSAPEGIVVHWRYHPTTGKRYLALDVGFWTDWYYLDLPPSPTDYWLTQP